MKNILWCALLVMSPCAVAQQGMDPAHTQSPRLSGVTCPGLDAFADNNEIGIAFGVDPSNWSDRDVAFLVSATYNCKRDMINALSQNNRLTSQTSDAVSLRTEMIIKKIRIINSENRAADRRVAANKAELAQAQRLESDRLSADLATSQAACIKSDGNMAYQIQENVIQGVAAIADWKSSAAQEAKISRASGIRNLSREYSNGEGRVESQDALNQAWQAYKEIGGKATSPQRVAHTLKDPCLQFTPREY